MVMVTFSAQWAIKVKFKIKRDGLSTLDAPMPKGYEALS